MSTRKHVHAIELPHPAERVFALLHTPSAIRRWWSADRAVVVPRAGGFWAAAWGEDEDDPEYVSVFPIEVFEPPRRLVFGDGLYLAKAGPLPFEARFTTEFVIDPTTTGCRLQVTQDGFPTDPVADDFYAGCEAGWRETFNGIRQYLQQPP